MSDAVPLQPEQSLADGRFVLVRPLGRGGMGEVWLARDERLNEPVALKFLPPEIRGDLAALDDLRRETSRSRKLTHPNIVRIHDLHEEIGGTPFIVMEYVDGQTLAGLRIEQEARVLSWEYLRPLVQQLCAALDYAHTEKVVHRDLKPANIMVDSRGRLKLADFGIAAVMTDSMSRISVRQTASGTLVFMSPQQLAGKSAQASDDIYALGATLYELLTSRTPFYTGDLTHQILNEPTEPIAERLEALGVINEVPSEVSAMIMACLSKERDQRPPSALAVAEWIGLAVADRSSGKHLAGLESPPVEVEATPVASPVGGKRTALLFGILVLVSALAVWQLSQSRPAKRAVATTAPPPPAATSNATAKQDSPPPPQAKPKTEPAPATKPSPPLAQLLKPGVKFFILAGQPGKPGAADGRGASARFNNPCGLVFADGALFVADTDNHTIRKITPEGVTSTVAGAPGVIGVNNGLGTAAHFDRPEGMSANLQGVLLVADAGNHTLRAIAKDNRVTTRAGLAGRKGSTDDIGKLATFNQPVGIDFRGGVVYVADSANHAIRCLTGNDVTTLAGKAGESGSADGYAAEARFNQPMGVAAVPGREGDIYVADTGNNTIRKISALGTVTPVAGKAGSAGYFDGRGNLARFNQPRCIRWQKGVLYVEDAGNNVIRMVASDGTVSTLGSPSGDLALDSSGNIYVADYHHHVILTTLPTGNEFIPPPPTAALFQPVKIQAGSWPLLAGVIDLWSQAH